MDLTLKQRSNVAGFPKAAELIEITGAHGLEASDRAILNLLYQHAHDSGRLGDPSATWHLPITALRPSKHNGTDRIRDSLSRILSVQVKVGFQEVRTGHDRILLTHLFECFDLPGNENLGGPVRYRVPLALVPILSQSSRWGRIKAEVVCSMRSKYAIAVYELIQLHSNMNRFAVTFPMDRFRALLGVPPGAYKRGNDLLKRVINPAMLEVNGLSEFRVQSEIERAYSRARITGVVLKWWCKREEESRATVHDLQRSKLDRASRTRGDASTMDV
jgi:Initiator Rep protein, WH2